MSKRKSTPAPAPASTALERAEPPAELARYQRTALAAGAIGIAACVAGALLNPEQFYRSYLVGFLFWIGITLGSFSIAMLHHLTGGAWGIVIRRVLEAASRTLPLMAIAFLPILLGLPHLYLWARPEAAHDPLLVHKAPFLNPKAFAARGALYFLLLGFLAFLLNRWSREQDQTGAPELRQRMRLFSAPGLVIYCLAVTFIGIDWLMSLDPHWFSSIYGIYVIGGQGLAGLAFVILVARWLERRPPMAGVIRPHHFGDYGNLMLAFVMLWAYFSVSQLIIIWAGNLPEEIPWYMLRLHGEWGWVGLALVLLHFAVPFALLLSRTVKTTPRMLAGVAAIVLVMRWVDIYWQAGPTFNPQHVRLHWLDLAALVALGGPWLALFIRELGRRALLPVKDPGLQEAVAHE